MYQLIKGSIFDSKCDLLIIPCNNWKGTSNDIRLGIKENSLPHSKGKVEFGDVRFYETTGVFNNSYYVGYAASIDVQTNKSDECALTRIMESIYDFSIKNNVQSINIPLLGTGVGKLEYSVSLDILKEKFIQDRNIWLNIYVPKASVYSALCNQTDNDNIDYGNPAPRVFISYTSTNKENKNWVKILVDKLRGNGVNARVDFYCLRHGYDLPQWMTNEIMQADKVILICDRNYAEKADIRKGGVGWETMIIQGDMMWRSSEMNKYIAIVREENYDESLPIYLRSKYFFHWSDGDISDPQFKELMYSIFDCDIEPPIGKPPEYILRQNKNHIR